MNAHRRHRRHAGFTLIELLIVMALLSILLLLGLPNFFNMIERQKILGITQQTAVLLRLARLEAIKSSGNAVVQIDSTAGTVTAFVDSNQNNTLDSSEKQLGQLTLPKGVSFVAVFGFTSPPTPAIAVFRANGTVLAAGAFRFKNVKGDQLEARVLSQSGGQVRVQKLQGSSWVAQGEGGAVWTWN